MVAFPDSHVYVQTQVARDVLADLPTVEASTGLNPKLKALLSQFKQSLQSLYDDQLVALILYGSFARREEAEGSDIDVLVVLKHSVDHA